MRVLFAGTPQAAVPSLEALLSSHHEVVAVLTRPDAASGRGRRVERSAVGQCAQAHGIPVWTPPSPRDEQFLDDLQRLAPQACPVVAYGGLIPRRALDVPVHGWINLHFSLLPLWRGAAPVQWAIRNGDERTGATTFRLDEGLDTGPVYAALEQPIGPRDNSGELLDRLAHAGAELLVRTLDGIEEGHLVPTPQAEEGISLAPKIDVAQARIDWTAPADDIDRLIRSCTPAPGAWSTLRGERIKISPVLPLEAAHVRAGELVPGKREVLVGTGTGPVVLGEVRPEGRNPMAAADWARGLRLEAGEAFT